MLREMRWHRTKLYEAKLRKTKFGEIRLRKIRLGEMQLREVVFRRTGPSQDLPLLHPPVHDRSRHRLPRTSPDKLLTTRLSTIESSTGKRSTQRAPTPPRPPGIRNFPTTQAVHTRCPKISILPFKNFN